MPGYTMVPVMLVPDGCLKADRRDMNAGEGHGKQEEDGATKAAGKTS
jgi:hypothetical protein